MHIRYKNDESFIFINLAFDQTFTQLMSPETLLDVITVVQGHLFKSDLASFHEGNFSKNQDDIETYIGQAQQGQCQLFVQLDKESSLSYRRYRL